jgi:nucleotide-binding universal stress UspA family protein
MIPAIHKILYATDLSETARHAFGYAADLAVRYKAELTILYVMENLNYTSEVQVSEMVGPEVWEKLKRQKQEYLTQKIQDRVETFCKEMASAHEDYPLSDQQIRIERGNPQEVILETSRQIGADLIVMGTHGYNILKDALIGGTARKVVRNSAVPVMVIRLPKKKVSGPNRLFKTGLPRQTIQGCPRCARTIGTDLG